MHESIVKNAKGAVPLHAVKAIDLKQWLASRPKREQGWLKAANFSAKDGELVLIPGMRGLAGVALGLGSNSPKAPMRLGILRRDLVASMACWLGCSELTCLGVIAKAENAKPNLSYRRA
jgi:hypothetical protein